MKTKHPVHILVFGVFISDASIYIPTWPRIQHERLHQVPGGGSADLDQ